jgi:hypothetical protein
MNTIIQKWTIHEWGQANVTEPGYDPAAGSCGNKLSGLHKLCENWLAKRLAASSKSHLPSWSNRRQASFYLWPSSLLSVSTQQHNLLLLSRITCSLLFFIQWQVRAMARWPGAHPKVNGVGGRRDVPPPPPLKPNLENRQFICDAFPLCLQHYVRNM